MKKSLVMALCIALCAALATGGTLAYLQDQQSDVNVMTLGSVYIKQHEYQRAEGVEHNAGEAGAGNGVKKGALVPFVQGQPLYPAVPADNTAYTAEADDLFYWGDYVYSGTAGNGLWNDTKLANVMDKMIFVENTGKSDAYVRTIIAFECPEGMEYSQGSDKEFMMNTNGSETAYKWAPAEDDKLYVTIDDVRYLVLSATYQKVLKPGATSHPSLLQVVMTHNATNEDMKLLGDSYEILALSQAVQTAGFADAQTALDTAFGKVNEDNIKTWFTDEENEVNIPKFVNTDAELKDALKNGDDVILNGNVEVERANTESNGYATTGINVLDGQTINGNGNKFGVDAWSTWDSAINTTGGTIKNLTVNKGMRGIFINHNSDHSEKVVLENVIIDGTVYTISCDQGTNQGLEAYNSTFNGWTSYAATIGNVKFVDCSFGEGQGYSYNRPYAPTEYVNCAFEAGYTLDPRAAVTFENCTLGGVALTAANIDQLVIDTAKATIK